MQPELHHHHPAKDILNQPRILSIVELSTLSLEDQELMMKAGMELEFIKELSCTVRASRDNITPETTLNLYIDVMPFSVGGNGVILKGYDPIHKRIVALKLPLHTHLPHNVSRIRDAAFIKADIDNFETFYQEAELSFNLQHPHVLNADSLVLCHEVPGIILPFMNPNDQPTLKKAIKKYHAQVLPKSLDHRSSTLMYPMSLELIVEVTKQLAQTLTDLYHQDVIYHDLKPDNIFLTPEGIKLSDFGEIESDASHLSKGTIPYCSAEVILHLQNKITTAELQPHILAGITYQMAVVIYEMLTGRVPFDGAQTSDIIAAILNQPFRLSDSDHQTLRVRAQQENLDIHALDTLFSRAFAKNPILRFQTPHDLLGHLMWALGA